MPHEQQPGQSELHPELVAAYAHTFISRFDRYPRQNLDGSYIAIPSPLPITTIEAHLRGQFTIGAYALDEHSHAKWLCLDADEPHEWDVLRTLADDLNKQRVIAYLESSSRGGHLWFFFGKPLPGKDARRFARALVKDRGINHIEIYPRQDELRTGPGSLVRLPLGFHQKDTPPHRYGFVTLSGEPLGSTVREQLAILAHPQTIPGYFLADMLATAPEAAPVFPTPRFKKGKKRKDMPPSERIKNAVSVYDFVSQFVDLDKNGRGLCPYHDDHRQSFSVHRDNNFWHCFARKTELCRGQTVIDFWRNWRRLYGLSDEWNEVLKDLMDMLHL